MLNSSLNSKNICKISADLFWRAPTQKGAQKIFQYPQVKLLSEALDVYPCIKQGRKPAGFFFLGGGGEGQFLVGDKLWKGKTFLFTLMRIKK